MHACAHHGALSPQVRLGETTSTIHLLNASLVAAEARALRAAEKAQQSEAAQRQLAMDDTERAKRAAAREVELEKVTAADCMLIAC